MIIYIDSEGNEFDTWEDFMEFGADGGYEIVEINLNE